MVCELYLNKALKMKKKEHGDVPPDLQQLLLDALIHFSYQYFS